MITSQLVAPLHAVSRQEVRKHSPCNGEELQRQGKSLISKQNWRPMQTDTNFSAEKCRKMSVENISSQSIRKLMLFGRSTPYFRESVSRLVTWPKKPKTLEFALHAEILCSAQSVLKIEAVRSSFDLTRFEDMSTSRRWTFRASLKSTFAKQKRAFFCINLSENSDLHCQNFILYCSRRT